MHFVTFQGYRSYGVAVTVVAERVTHFAAIDFNGNHGTEIFLDTGKSIRVEERTWDVEKMLTVPA